MTTQHEAKKREAERLLALAARHKDSNWTCERGHKPMMMRDPLARVLLTDVGDEDICPHCRAKLESVGQGENEDFVVQLRPRGLADDAA